MKLLFLTGYLCLVTIGSFGQQLADHTFHPDIPYPEYEKGNGPQILLDEAHNNFHKLDERYYSFGKVVELDGYRINSNKQLLSGDVLKNAKILVIANAIHESNMGAWAVPVASAFSKEEIKEVNQWVKNGGRLFLIADHMPFPGSAEDLAASFGFKMNNGFALSEPGTRPDIFTRENQMLGDNEISNGRKTEEKIMTVASFTGQGFKIPENATSLLTFNEKYYSLMPDTAWAFNPDTRRISLENWSQGAYMNYGKGKIVVFGEAAMFTTQVVGTEKRAMGMNAEEAKENVQFLLNIIHWLDEDVE